MFCENNSQFLELFFKISISLFSINFSILCYLVSVHYLALALLPL